MIDIVVGAALAAGCTRAVVAGETRSSGATNVSEKPRFGGPVAGLAAALPTIDEDWIMLLACDLPRAGGLCRLIADGARSGPAADGVVVTSGGRTQWIAGWYRRAALEGQLTRCEDPAGSSLRDLLGSLHLREVHDREGLSRDIDTPDDLYDFMTGKGER